MGEQVFAHGEREVGGVDKLSMTATLCMGNSVHKRSVSTSPKVRVCACLDPVLTALLWGCTSEAEAGMTAVQVCVCACVRACPDARGGNPKRFMSVRAHSHHHHLAVSYRAKPQHLQRESLPGSVEYRDVQNAYGVYYHMATAQRRF